MHTPHFYVHRHADPPILLRRTGPDEEVFRGGEWLATAEIHHWDVSLDAFAQISESEAQMRFPAAFAGWV